MIQPHRSTKSSLPTAFLALTLLFFVGLALSSPALAQFSDSYKFLQAVRKSDSKTVNEMIDQPGVTPVNTRDATSGETALIITVGRSDAVWTNFMLDHGADPRLTDNRGRTPLMIAVTRRFLVGAQLLLEHHADPDQQNDSGETPLIRAVQVNDTDMVRLLLAAGADPTHRDSLAGMDAIDYAQRSPHQAGMLKVLQDKADSQPKKKADVQGPHL